MIIGLLRTLCSYQWQINVMNPHILNFVFGITSFSLLRTIRKSFTDSSYGYITQ